MNCNACLFVCLLVWVSVSECVCVCELKVTPKTVITKKQSLLKSNCKRP